MEGMVTAFSEGVKVIHAHVSWHHIETSDHHRTAVMVTGRRRWWPWGTCTCMLRTTAWEDQECSGVSVQMVECRIDKSLLRKWGVR